MNYGQKERELSLICLVNCIGHTSGQQRERAGHKEIKHDKTQSQNLHSCLNVKYSVRCLHSWLPRKRKKVVGYKIFNAHRYRTHCNKKLCKL